MHALSLPTVRTLSCPCRARFDAPRLGADDLEISAAAVLTRYMLSRLLHRMLYRHRCSRSYARRFLQILGE
jgi:hypothetical protein